MISSLLINFLSNPPAVRSTIVILGIIAAAALVLQKFDWNKKSSKPGQEVNPKEDIDPEILGKNYLIMAQSPLVVLGEEARYQHLQLVGASGTGKTRCGILPYIYQDIRKNAGVGVLDVKSNMGRKITGFAAASGRLHDYLRFELRDPENSLTYNPLVGDDPTEVANRISTALYQDDKTDTPFYREAAMNFMRNFFGVCHELRVLPTFKQLRQVAADQQQLELFTSLAPHTDQAKTLKQRFGSLNRMEYNKLLEGLVNKLAPLTDGPFAKLLNTTEPEIDLRDVVSKSKVVVFGLAADMYPSDYKVLSTMILMDLHSCLTSRYQTLEQRGFFLYLDEVADLVYPKFRDLVAKAREAKVGLIFAHQALGDLRAVSEAFMDSIIASSANKVMFRLGTSDTAEQFSKLIGTKTVIERKVNYSLQNGNDPRAKGYTDQEFEKFLVHPNELKNLPVGEAVMIIQRPDGRRLYKAKTFSQENLAALDRKAIADDWMLYRKPDNKKSYSPLLIEARPVRPSLPPEEKKTAQNSEVMSMVSGKTPPRPAAKPKAGEEK